MVAKKLMEYQGMDSPGIIASLSDGDITVVCDVIKRPDGLVSGRMSDSGNQISALVAKSLKLATFMFKTIECCSKPYDVNYVHSRRVLEYQY